MKTCPECGRIGADEQAACYCGSSYAGAEEKAVAAKDKIERTTVRKGASEQTGGGANVVAVGLPLLVGVGLFMSGIRPLVFMGLVILVVWIFSIAGYFRGSKTDDKSCLDIFFVLLGVLFMLLTILAGACAMMPRF